MNKQPITAVLSLVLGILSIFSLGIVSKDNPILSATVTTLLGMMAVGLAILAFRKNKKRKMWISGIVMGGLAVMAQVATLFVILISLVFSGGGIGSDYKKALDVLESAPKALTRDQTARIGHYLVEVKNVQPNYTPSGSELANIRILKSSELYGLDTAEQNSKYVRVTLNVKYEEDERIKGLQFSGNLKERIAKVKLNDVWALATDPDTFYNRYNNVLKEAETKQGVDIAYVFRIHKNSQALDLVFSLSVYKSVHPIVGTEGMPTEFHKYTIKL